MRKYLVAGSLALLVSGCAADTPIYPTPIVVPPSTTPASIQLGASSRPDFKTSVVATVYTADKHVVPNVPIAFSTTAGTILSEQTRTDSNGTATAVISSPTTATVSATIGGAVSSSVEIFGASAPSVPSQPPVVPPDVRGPVAPAAVINVASVGTTGVPVSFGVSSIAGQTWLWTFGDGGTVQTTAYTLAHTYTSPGTYTATVASAGTGSGSAVITISDPPPSTTAALTLAATISCTPGTHGTTSTSCNLSGVTYGGSTIASAAVSSVSWDFGDGTVLTGLVVTHTYALDGNYSVLATVTANTSDGSKTTTTSKSIVVP